MAKSIAMWGAGLLLLASGVEASEIYRCTAAGGAVTYQQQPCGPASDGGAVNIPTHFPDHAAARDRLMAREAALDARLIKRLEIEAAERIARDQRIARERELQAERERTERERAQNAPVFIIGFPQRVIRSPDRRGASGIPRNRPTW